MGNLTIYELEKLQDSPGINSFNKKIIDILLAAINDWPDPIYSLNDYELVVRNFVGGVATPMRINAALSRIDYLKESWNAESLSQIEDLLKLYDNRVSLNEIIIELELIFEERRFL